MQVVLADASEEIKQAKWLGAVDALQVDLYDEEAAAPVLDSAEFYADCRATLTEEGCMTVNLFGRSSSFQRQCRQNCRGLWRRCHLGLQGHPRRQHGGHGAAHAQPPQTRLDAGACRVHSKRMGPACRQVGARFQTGEVMSPIPTKLPTAQDLQRPAGLAPAGRVAASTTESFPKMRRCARLRAAPRPKVRSTRWCDWLLCPCAAQRTKSLWISRY